MESASEPGHIMLSEQFFRQIQQQLESNKFKVTCQKKEIKGKGCNYCYLVKIKTKLSSHSQTHAQ